MVSPQRRSRIVAVSLVLLELFLFLTSTSRLPSRRALASQPASASSRGPPPAASKPAPATAPDAATQRDPRDWSAPGSLFNPCTEPSAYYKERLEWLRVMSQERGVDTATRCLNCLHHGQYPETCESQFGQDMFLWHNFFRCLPGPGSYIDVGAHKPMMLSTTWMLDHCLGWKQGLCAEANGGYTHELSQARTCAIEHAALSVAEGTAIMDGGGAGGALVNGSTTPGFDVRVTTLATALAKHKWIDPNAASGELVIDFMTVDVELHELEVLYGVPWDRVFIRFILVENVRASQDVFEFLVDKGYVKVFTLAVDDLYARIGVPLERSSRLEYHRRTVAHTRRNSGVPTYDHPALYAGWNHVNEHVNANKAIPKE